MISYYVDDLQKDWPSVLPYVVSAYNNTIHSSTGRTPHETVFGFEMRSLFDLAADRRTEYEPTQQLQERLHNAWEIVKRNNHAAFKRYARQHNKKAEPHRIAIGDRVLVKNVITKKGISRKISPLWTGPYEVVGKTGPSTIRIRRGSNIVLMHANRLKLGENSNSDINSVGISASRAVAETATEEKADAGRRKKRTAEA
jgi:hypothetical protein